jgi:hypothetical protein
MRATACIAAALVGLTGCSGGGATPPGTTTQTQLVQLELGPATPLAVGQSVTIDFREKTCRIFPNPQPGRPGNFDTLGCDPLRIPSALVVTVVPLASGGGACSATATVSAPGAVTATKTGAGDPQIGGFCDISVTDGPPALGLSGGFGI